MSPIPNFVYALRIFAILAFMLCYSALSHAGIENGNFDMGLSGWDSIGDTTIQDSSLGLATPNGQGAWMTTLCGGDDATCAGGGRTGVPYGTNAVHALAGFSILGWTFNAANLAENPASYFTDPYPQPRTAISAIRQVVELQAGDRITFNYRFVFAGVDAPFVSLYQTDGPGRLLQSLRDFTGQTVLSGVALCSRVLPPDPCGVNPGVTSETGYLQASLVAPIAGTYILGFGIGDAAGTGRNPAGLFVDNVTLAPIPEPSTYALIGAGVLAIGSRIRARREKAYTLATNR